jgi:hypothetical protein
MADSCRHLGCVASVRRSKHMLQRNAQAQRGAVRTACCRQYAENGGSLDALSNATELSFAADSRSSYSLDDDVVLQLHTKNTGTEVGAPANSMDALWRCTLLRWCFCYTPSCAPSTGICTPRWLMQAARWSCRVSTKPQTDAVSAVVCLLLLLWLIGCAGEGVCPQPLEAVHLHTSRG